MIFRYKIEIISDIEQKIRKLLVNIAVAPFVGVWVEILGKSKMKCCLIVAPFVGVWVEMLNITVNSYRQSSLPSWECGLKSDAGTNDVTQCSRSLRGSVG